MHLPLSNHILPIAVTTLLLALSLPAASPSPLPNAHAHNDYFHERPLLDALDQGFCSVEADIHFVQGQLLVAHDLSASRPDRDLDTLYLKPLHERVNRNRGRVHPDHPAFLLLVDFKSDAADTYRALKPLLESHREILTAFTQDTIRTNAVTIILSGNRPLQQMLHETNRLCALDARTSDLDANPPASLYPLVSENWASHFSWRGGDPFPEPQSSKLRSLVQQAHAQGRRVRFWNAPDGPAGWQVLRDAGVDLINTDRLAALRSFLLEETP